MSRVDCQDVDVFVVCFRSDEVTVRGCIRPSVGPSVRPWILNAFVLHPARSDGAGPCFIYTLLPFVRLADVHSGIRLISRNFNDAGVNDR